MKLNHGWVLPTLALGTIVFSTDTMAQEDNPFQLQQPKPEVQVVQPVIRVPENPNLSDTQKQQVYNMIKQSVSALELKVEDAESVEIEGAKYVLLKEGDSFIGVSSGMYVIYDSLIDDYSYFDTQEYLEVISEKNYDEMVSEAKSRAASLIGEITGLDAKSSAEALRTNKAAREVVAPPESAKQQTPPVATPTVKPIKIKQ